jgi:hypothetical protein
MGMDDYIQCLYPEDDISAHGSYLMLRSYPDFTARRLAIARSSCPNPSQVPHKFADIYAVRNPEKLLEQDKGSSQIVGLWMFATDAREPMITVMLRYVVVKPTFPATINFSIADSIPTSRGMYHTQRIIDMAPINLRHLIRTFASVPHHHHKARVLPPLYAHVF